MRFTCGFAIRSAVVLLALAAGGCASVFRSPTPNQLHITSEPDSAQVLVGGLLYGTTPTRLNLPSATRYILEYRKPGYHTRYDTVETSISTGWLIADIACSLPAFGAPAAFDYLFGQWYSIDTTDERQHVRLLPDPTGTAQPTPTDFATTGQSARPALLLEVGFASPTYQLPVVPTSYSAGFGFAPAQWCVLALRQEIHGTEAMLVLPNNTGVPTSTETSLIVLATTVDIRVPIWSTGMYIAGGAGAMHASAGYNKRTIAAGWLPLATAGAGYVFPGEKWFADVRYTSALSAMRVTQAHSDYRPHYTTFRFGLRLPF